MIFYDVMSSIKNFENLIVDSFARAKKISLRSVEKRNTKRVLSNDDLKFLWFIFKRRWFRSTRLRESEMIDSFFNVTFVYKFLRISKMMFYYVLWEIYIWLMRIYSYDFDLTFAFLYFLAISIY